MITLTNDFHNTETTVRIEDDPMHQDKDGEWISNPILNDEEFLKCTGTICPVCREGIQPIEGECLPGGIESEDTMELECTCPLCKSLWVELYKLAGYEIINNGKEDE